jgi:hypothetical protein
LGVIQFCLGDYRFLEQLIVAVWLFFTYLYSVTTERATFALGGYGVVVRSMGFFRAVLCFDVHPLGQFAVGSFDVQVQRMGGDPGTLCSEKDST